MFAARYIAALKLRTAYLIVTLMLAFFTYILLAALGASFASNRGPKSGILGAISIGALYGSLPARYANGIAAIPGIQSVKYGDLVAAYCRKDITVSLNGMEAVGISPIPKSVVRSLSRVQLRHWRQQRNGVLVGSRLAKRCHWHAGVLLTLKRILGSHAIFNVSIVAVYHVTHADNPYLNQVVLAHYRYLDSLQPKVRQGMVMWMNATAADPRVAQRLAVVIDTHFARFSPPTESSVSATSQGALARFGNVLKVIEFVMAAVFACALLVTVNVAAHAAAGRRAQFALFRVLGFSRTWLTLLAVTELFYVVAIGCGLGLALGFVVLHWVVRPLLGSLFSGFFVVPESALALAPVFAAGIVLISVLIPVWEIFRTRGVRLSAP